MPVNNPAAYYAGPQDYAAFFSSGDHIAQPASSHLEVSYLDHAHQQVPAALIQQHSAHYNSDCSLSPARSRTGNTPLSHGRFHPYRRQSRSTTASDQKTLAAVVDSWSSSSSSAYPVNPHISYPKPSPSFPPTSCASNPSSHIPSTNYSLATPSTVMYPGHQHVPSKNEYHAILPSTSIQHSLSYRAIPNTYTSELASALIPNTPYTNQDDSSDLIEVHSPMVDPALPYPTSDNALALSSDHWDSIPSHACANQSSTTTLDHSTGPSSSYPSVSSAISLHPSAINELYPLFVAPNVSQFGDTSHPQVHMAINGGQGHTIFGDQENNVYYQTDDRNDRTSLFFLANEVALTDFEAINELWKEIANVGAHHDSGARFPPPRCHEGTRTKVQKSILDWAQSDDPNNEPLCWLSGPAGVGKSAIAQTIAETTNEGSLIASFFFWRGDPQRNNPSKLFLVIAHGLALRYPELRHSIGQVIKEKPSILKASIDVQLQKLIIEPLFQFTTVVLDGLIIIDALDECSGEKEQRHVLCLIESIFSKIQGRLPRILLCSRPEPSIQETLSTLDKDLHVRRLTLDDNWESRRDIEKFLNKEFTRIRNCDRCKNLDFPVPWPSPSQIWSLSGNACGQFIYATTIIRFIDDGFYNPCEQLQKVLGQQKNDSEDGDSPFTPLDALYHQILSSYPKAKQKQLRDALGFLMYFQYPEMVPDLITMEILYGLPAGGAELLLRRARSLIKGVEDGAPEIIHKSFRDYLEDESRSHEFFIDKEIYSKTFFSCLQLEAVIREANRDLTRLSSDQRYCNCMIAFTREAFEYIWSTDSTHEAFDTDEVYDFVIKLSLFHRRSLSETLPSFTHNICYEDDEAKDAYIHGLLSMHLGTTKNVLPVFARLRLRIRREGMSNEDILKLVDILQILWMTGWKAKEAFESSDFHEFLDTHKAIIISNLCAFDPECENYCSCLTPYWDSPVHLCGGHYIISPMSVLFTSAYAIEEDDSSKLLYLVYTLKYWEYGLRHLFDDGEYHLKKFEIIEKALPAKEWETANVLFAWLLLSPIRLPTMGNAYHTRVLKFYTLLLDKLAYNERWMITSYWETTAHICGAEPELLDPFTRWFELFGGRTEWCLEWLESFPAIHAKKSRVAIAKLNTFQQKWKDLRGAREDLREKRKSTEEVSELLFGELAPQDLDANDIHIIKEIVRGSEVSTKLRCRDTEYVRSWINTLEHLRPYPGPYYGRLWGDQRMPLHDYIEWIKPSDWPYETEPNSTVGAV
ncbi:hypothetical protein VNI00_015179 [Paramarasmius palmivorus]|uniref:Nephrocystin 3-like N-terminal domain-containing protein n=1 Tax=Paramarasmius palmivorus TaxID=297713 RepID=A0AAW0BME9_9AGAR